MSTLTTDQGLIIPASGDNDNVPLSVSDLVLGTSDNGLESRLVKRYTSAADRTTRNPGPETGEVSYRADAGIYEYYTGSTWLALRPGYVAETVRSSNVSAITTTETVLDSATFTAVSGQRYKVSAVFFYQSSVAADLALCRLRWQAGGTLTSAGTEFHSSLMNCAVANRGDICVMIRTLTGVSGQITVGSTMVRSSGSGTLISAGGASQQSTLLVEIV